MRKPRVYYRLHPDFVAACRAFVDDTARRDWKWWQATRKRARQLLHEIASRGDHLLAPENAYGLHHDHEVIASLVGYRGDVRGERVES